MRSWPGVALVLLLPLSAWSLDITACGTTVPPNQTGILQADLACGDAFEYGVRLSNGATLEMNGHSITGADFGIRCFEPDIFQPGVFLVRCVVRGPGTVTGSGVGVALRRSSLTISDVDIAGAFRWGGIQVEHVVGYPSRVIASNVTVSGSAGAGIETARLKATNVTVTGNGGDGVFVTKVLKGDGVSATGNAGAGLALGGRFALTNLTATNNGGVGLSSLKGGGLRDSVLTGNDGAGGGYDLVTHRRPRLVATTCGKSFNPETSTSWGVCSGD